MVRYEEQLETLITVEKNWNSYDSDAPTQEAIDRARLPLDCFICNNVEPEMIRPDADGGVAFIFVGKNSSRATFCSLNNGERYLILYYLDQDPIRRKIGLANKELDVTTIDWNDWEQPKILFALITHLNGE